MENYKIYNNLFRYFATDRKLEGLKHSYLEFEETNPFFTTDDGYVSTISPIIRERTIKKEDVKTVNFSDIKNLEDVIFNFYIENGTYHSRFELSFDSSFDEIHYTIMLFSNHLASMNRIGLPNKVFIPKDLYQKYYLLFNQNDAFFEHDFKGHQDKILCLVLKDGVFDNLHTVITDTELLDGRYIKLRNIIKKTNGKIIDKSINYTICPGNNKSKYTVGYIKLK